MKFTCIIAEFNPLTLGHIKIIEEAKKQTQNPIICIMSGNFVQRGEPAITDKYTRAKISIENGVDVVIELPTIYTLSSAKDFAFGAIKTLNSLNCVEYLMFGSESGSIDELNKLRADINTSKTSLKIKENLKNGLSYSLAVSNALNKPLKSNDILAIEYLNALDETNSKIKPLTILREDNFNDFSINKDCSASAIRNELKNNNLNFIKSTFPHLNKIENKNITNYALFEKLVEYKIKTTPLSILTNINGTNEGIENFIQKSYFDNQTKIQTKRYPATKINRILCNALLEIEKSLLSEAKINDSTYFKVLAINNSKKHLLSFFPNSKLVASKKDLEKLNDLQTKIIEKDILASKIFSCINDGFNGIEDFTMKI